MANRLRSLDYMRLLPEETSGTLRRLELLARAKMLGSIAGRHISPNKGFSVEFAEHRPYTPGDDLRNLDWRVYGKADRYFIKQYIEETNLRATLLLDASGSMSYRGEKASSIAGKQLSKFEYARYLAAALAYFMIRQQDAVGLVAFDERVRTYVRAASRPSQVRMLLEKLHAMEPGGDTEVAATFHEIAETIPPRGLVVVISDLFDDPGRIAEALHHFNYRDHEIVIFHVMADEELGFPFDRFHEFRDLESSGAPVKVDPRTIRAAYRAKVRDFIETIESACGRMKADYVPVNTSESYDTVLTKYLGMRLGRH